MIIAFHIASLVMLPFFVLFFFFLCVWNNNLISCEIDDEIWWWEYFFSWCFKIFFCKGEWYRKTQALISIFCTYNVVYLIILYNQCTTNCTTKWKLQPCVLWNIQLRWVKKFIVYGKYNCTIQFVVGLVQHTYIWWHVHFSLINYISRVYITSFHFICM